MSDPREHRWICGDHAVIGRTDARGVTTWRCAGQEPRSGVQAGEGEMSDTTLSSREAGSRSGSPIAGGYAVRPVAGGTWIVDGHDGSGRRWTRGFTLWSDLVAWLSREHQYFATGSMRDVAADETTVEAARRGE